MAERRFRLSPLSALLIVAGIALLAWGLVILLGQRPTAAEQAALARGRVVSQEGAGLAVTTSAVAEQDRSGLLPAPGVASLAEAIPSVALTAALQPEPEAFAQSIGEAPPDVPDRSRPTRTQSTDTTPGRSDQPAGEPASGPTTGQATPARIPAQSPPTRIVAPTIGLDSPVVEVGWQVVKQDGKMVSTWGVADYAAGFHKNSAYPGNPGNTVLSGHHNIKGEVFRYLVDLEIGDPVYLYADGRQYVYRVVDLFIVQEAGASLEQRRRNAQWIAPTTDERLTLVTCWPYWTNTHRVIVTAEPVEVKEPAEPNTLPRVPRE